MTPILDETDTFVQDIYDFKEYSDPKTKVSITVANLWSSAKAGSKQAPLCTVSFDTFVFKTTGCTEPSSITAEIGEERCIDIGKYSTA